MKKLFLIFIMGWLSLFSTAVFAHPKTGIRGGWSLARLSSFNGESRLGIHAGFYARFNLGKQWRFQPELLYSGEGHQYRVNGEKSTIALGYAQIPLLLQYLPAKKLSLEFGPQFGILVHAVSLETEGAKLNVKRSFNNTQVSLVAGASLQVSKRVGVFGRYQLGLTDVTLGDIIDRSHVLQFGIGLVL